MIHDDSDPPFLPPKPRRRRRLFWVGVPLVLLGAAAVGLYFSFDHQADLAIRDAIAETDRLEPNGWRLADIEQQRRATKPNDKDNAAIAVRDVQALMPTLWPPQSAVSGGSGRPIAGMPAQAASLNDRIALPLEVQMDAALTAEIRAELAKDKIPEAVNLADQLADQKVGHHDINWPANPLAAIFPWIQEPRTIAALLRYRALLQAQDGDTDGALRTARAILGAGRSLSDDPTLIGLLVRIAVQSIAVSSIERTLAQGVPSAEALKLTQLMLEEEAADPSLQRALRGERASNVGVCEWLLNGGGSLADLDISRSSGDGIRASLETVGQKQIVKRGYPMILRTMNESVEVAGLPVEQQKPAFDQLEQKMKRQAAENTLVRVLLPSLMTVVEAHLRVQAKLRTGIGALAAERFRQEHQRWPQSVAELTDGKYLSDLLADPYDGKALRYKQISDGFLVYSVGPDETDNGGVMNCAKPGDKGTDLGFQLWNPERRRQRPAELLPCPSEQGIPASGQQGLPPAVRGFTPKPSSAVSLRELPGGGRVSPLGMTGGIAG